MCGRYVDKAIRGPWDVTSRGKLYAIEPRVASQFIHSPTRQYPHYSGLAEIALAIQAVGRDR